ncbi:MAG: protein kinase [Myxococcales bacterium]|nr:protein kinase [Myxococcales bacterium]
MGAVRPGTVLDGRYEVEHELGRGAMGTVYAAGQLSMSRPVAIKVLASRFVGDRRERARFRWEAEAAARIAHPHVLRVIDHGIDAKIHRPFTVMERLSGSTLQAILRSCGALSVEMTAAILRQICDGSRQPIGRMSCIAT